MCSLSVQKESSCVSDVLCRFFCGVGCNHCAPWLKTILHPLYSAGFFVVLDVANVFRIFA